VCDRGGGGGGGGAPPPPPPGRAPPPRTNQSFAWNHGDIQDEIASTWVGYVGPGVRHLGSSDAWTDHTDVRPTMLSLLGLVDDYRPDGRVVFEILDDAAVPDSLRTDRATLTSLARVYKQIAATFGDFDMTTLQVSTSALASSSSNDQTYVHLSDKLATIGAKRDALALQMSTMLTAAAFGGQPIDHAQASGLIGKGEGLLEQAHELAAEN